MPLFEYTGQLSTGEAFDGTLEAASHETAEQRLISLGIRATRLQAVRSRGFVAPLSASDFQLLNEQIAALSKSNVPLERGLRELAADVASGRLRRVITELADDLESGHSLDDALARQRERFPADYAGVVQAGLATGDLGATLYSLSSHLRLRGTLSRALVELTAYPLAVFLLAMMIMHFATRWIFPVFEEIYGDFDTQLPALTVAVLDAARVWPTFELAALGVVLVLLLLCAYCAAPAGRGLRDALLRHLPLIRGVYWPSVLARFTQTSGLAAARGVPLSQLIKTAGQASGSIALAAATERAASELDNGRPLDEAAEPEPLIPRLWTQVVRTAGPRGDLPAALQELGSVYEQQALRAVGISQIIIGPMMFVVVGFAIALLVISILLPMLTLITNLSA